VEQELFTTSIYSPGSPLFLPNGARIFNKLTSFLRAQYAQFGFQEVITPTIYKKSLWEKSGHWENYAEDMFSVVGRGSSGQTEGKQLGEDEEYGLKPMNCPGHCLLFAAKSRSFREMPVRYADFSPLHRNEISGALSGLTRVRRFHQDDAHIFCRPSQIKEEISKTLEFVKLTYETFRLGSYKLALSTRPADHYIGTAEDWDRAESALKESLENSGQEWVIKEGDGAFYGPKIDIILKDSDGKEHQTATIQLDFQLPKRFELEYQAPAPELEQRGLTTEDPELLAKSGPVTPVIVHRAIFGSVERFMALLIEHYNGRWPFWLSPRQVAVLTVSDDKETVKLAETIKTVLSTGSERDIEAQTEYTALQLNQTQLAVELDERPISLGKKIREAKSKKYNVVIVVGKRDVETKTVSVNLSGTPDHNGKLKEAVLQAQQSTTSTEEVNLSDVKMTVAQLRGLLRHLESSYL
jgi:threonyl-tRNA synthetase